VLGLGGSAAAACPEPERCIEDYLALPARLPARELREPPLDGATVDTLVEALGRTPLRASSAEWEPAELERAIESALGLAFLRRQASREPAVEVVARNGNEQTLRLRTAYVGEFEALLLLPEGAGPFPAVLALHGHGDDAAAFRDLHHGRDYPPRGLALLIPTLRAMGIDAFEHRAARELLGHGLSLMGVRAYEALSAFAYLRALPEIDAQRIGLIGHSGGASLGNLLVRLEPGFAAYVSDHEVDYRSSGWREPYHCETVPGLFPLHRLLNDLSTVRPPVLRTRYGYGRRKLLGRERRESQRILAFFAEHLQPGRPASGG